MSSLATDNVPSLSRANGAANVAAELNSAQPAVLLIGYGNLMRSDDGVGPAIVSRLAAAFFDNPRCVTITTHQLTPELALDVARAMRVVFVDASVELPAGKAQIRRLIPHVIGNGSQQAHQNGLSHHVSPESIMALAMTVGGNMAAQAWAVAVGVANLSVGDRLSPPVSRTAGRLSRHLAHRIRRWSNPSLSRDSGTSL